MELRNQEKARTIRMPGSSTSYPHHHRNPPDQSHRQEEGKFSSFSSAATHTITGADQENGRGVEGRQGGEDEDDAAIYTQTLDHPPRHGQGRQQQEEEDGQQRKPRSDRADSADPAPSSIHRLHPDDQPPAPTTNPTAAPAATGSSDVSHLTGGSASSMKKYTECQRNHAAHLGGYVLDGCGEFMPGGEAGTPKALLCAACDCHRNFHRQVLNGEIHIAATQFPPPTMTPAANNTTTTILTTRPPLQSPPIAGGHLITPPAPLSSAAYYHQHHRIGPAMMAFGGGGGGGGAAAESSSEDLHMFGIAQSQQHRQGMMEYGSSGLGGSKKRFRTKFTQDQKDKMAEFAEKIGWRIQKQDDVELQQFCDQIGVKRRVFKVWMHNNKQGIKNKQG